MATQHLLFEPAELACIECDFGVLVDNEIPAYWLGVKTVFNIDDQRDEMFGCCPECVARFRDEFEYRDAWQQAFIVEYIEDVL